MCSERLDPSAGASPRPASRTFDRRGFLKVSAAGLLGVVMLGSSGIGRVFARAGSSPEPSLVAEFEQAAREYGVPVDLLLAMGYVNTRWEMPPPGANAYRMGDPHGWGSYGIMALVQNPYSDTLGEASRLTGIPTEVLVTDRAANIRGGAALLASSAGGYASGEPSDYFGAVAGRGLGAGASYTAVAGIGGGELYAEQVLETLQTGAAKRMLSGEMVTLPLRTPNLGSVYGWYTALSLVPGRRVELHCGQPGSHADRHYSHPRHPGYLRLCGRLVPDAGIRGFGPLRGPVSRWPDSPVRGRREHRLARRHLAHEPEVYMHRARGVLLRPHLVHRRDVPILGEAGCLPLRMVRHPDEPQAHSGPFRGLLYRVPGSLVVVGLLHGSRVVVCLKVECPAPAAAREARTSRTCQGWTDSEHWQ